VKRGLLYVGTDDGNLQVTQDDGRHWANLTKKIPGLPETIWVSGIEASRHNAGTVYVAFDGHRSNDFANYLFRSADFGNSWTPVVGDLPSNRVIHAVHEDPKNPGLIYIGTEHGLFLSADAGLHWIELKNNLPRVPVNDFMIHPRDNDLILATHGRGVWILDDIASLQQLTSEVVGGRAHLFTLRPVEEIRYFNPKAHQGDMVFHGDNPPPGAIIDYYLHGDPGQDLDVSVLDAAGKPIIKLQPTKTAGVNRVVWNLRYESLPEAPADDETGGRSVPMAGPLVLPGEYTVRLTAAGKNEDQKLQVKEDPRIQISPGDRKVWTDAQLLVADMYRSAVGLREQLGARGAAAAELQSAAKELAARLARLYRQMGLSTERPTADQQSQMQFFKTELDSLRHRATS
jgi:hypothetical protein